MRTPSRGSSSALAALVCSLLAPSGAAAMQATPYGSGVNPPDSLFLAGGQPAPGQASTLGMQNSPILGALPAFAALALALAPDPGFPAGSLLADYGLVV